MKFNLFPLTRHKNTLQLLPLPKAFCLLISLHFDLIYWNEIPDIRQKVMERIVNIESNSTFAFLQPKNERKRESLCGESAIIHLFQIFRIPWRHKVHAVDTRAVWNFMQIFTLKATLPNTWKFAVLSFPDDWQNVCFSFQSELISHRNVCITVLFQFIVIRKKC